MTNICERRVIQRLECGASHALAAFVAEHRAGDGYVHIALRLPIPMFAAWQPVIERRGIAEFYSLQSSSDRFPTYSVTWSARDGGPFPVFAGALAVERMSRSDCFGLILAGSYVPPLGRFGAFFDAAVGCRIARATARDLLGEVARYVEGLPLDYPSPGLLHAAVAAPAVSA